MTFKVIKKCKKLESIEASCQAEIKQLFWIPSKQIFWISLSFALKKSSTSNEVRRQTDGN